ncbi:lipopolysaccharide kinase [Syntrophotalea carbinolica DSM 2380]|uniref:Lipopolysaccharide kinase n=1 Tax=Syntrophotalea carbinolica (strain DSM 2380 / NBRC 103641 / GraBd1) TaxID=338963 RepID=Q3A533_SYNC1|nr:lipopolysaccharide core heptose(I) kinase RfaP [Syntrophotalea carbinolica]ABA88524.1 lipopolysaccharide kinase [Syntrophotalea carbinolica DSM 2380]
MQIWLADELRHMAPQGPKATFDWVMGLAGESVRRIERRHTFRVELGGRDYFVKQHYGLTWADIVGEVIRLRRPVLGAGNEYRMTALLNCIGIDTAQLVAFGVDGRWPTTQRSFIITRALPQSCTLNELCMQWKQQPSAKLKRQLIRAVGEIVAKMHGAGINHRDLYVNHFRLPLNWLENPIGEPPLFLMDLHRAQEHTVLSYRWRVKDLAALLFSVLGKPLSKRDHLRFLQTYFGERSLSRIFEANGGLFRAITEKAEAILHQQERRIKRKSAANRDE